MLATKACETASRGVVHVPFARGNMGIGPIGHIAHTPSATSTQATATSEASRRVEACENCGLHFTITRDSLHIRPRIRNCPFAAANINRSVPVHILLQMSDFLLLPMMQCKSDTRAHTQMHSVRSFLFLVVALKLSRGALRECPIIKFYSKKLSLKTGSPRAALNAHLPEEEPLHSRIGTPR